VWRLKGKGIDIIINAMMTYRSSIELHSFLTVVLEELSDHPHDSTTLPWEQSLQDPLNRSLGGTCSWSGRILEEINALRLLGFEPQIV